MRHTVVSTIPKEDSEAQAVLRGFIDALPDTQIIHTAGMDIHGCQGCYDCWLKTPGICSIQDDYQQVFMEILQSDRLILASRSRFGFITYQTKNLLDRILPIFTMHLKVTGRQMRHYLRYQKRIDIGLLIDSGADLVFLDTWLKRVATNLDAQSLGVYRLTDRLEMIDALGHH
ncbi:MAG: flavodoxin family protein [Coriobacteriales bacterium]|jgi:multimeric flavodoxin WrbA|nr:flavodoxin family protein [Coriobacteriales bacterium]